MDEEDQRHEVCAITQVPGLYLTDWVGAASVNEANILGITHILSILSDEELEQYGPDQTDGVELRRLRIKDEDAVNIVGYLDAEYDWMSTALLKSGAVIVHCQQGVSRSPAFVVAYLMRKQNLDYDSALKLVKQSRRIINVNAGFERQLRAWDTNRRAAGNLNKPSSPLCPKSPVKEIDLGGLIDWREEVRREDDSPYKYRNV